MVAGRVRWQHDPPLRTLTPQVAARARRPHRHLKARLRTDGPPLPHQPNHRAHTATQAPTVGSIIPAARTKKGHALPAAPQKTPQHKPLRPNRSPLHPTHPMSPGFHRGGLHFEQPHGRFRTIDPRHAGDTPQSSAYGSNSPQATNENKPHHHNKHTKTCRTRPTQPPQEHATLAHPSNHGGFCDHRPPTRRRHAARQRLW